MEREICTVITVAIFALLAFGCGLDAVRAQRAAKRWQGAYLRAKQDLMAAKAHARQASRSGVGGYFEHTELERRCEELERENRRLQERLDRAKQFVRKGGAA